MQMKITVKKNYSSKPNNLRCIFISTPKEIKEKYIF